MISSGANPADATAAVDAVAQAFSQYSDPTGWANVAILHLANEQIQQAEERQLAAAMEASRNQQEEVEAKELPIRDRPEEELRLRYTSSVMLSKLDGTSFRASLFQAPIRSPLVQLLEIERQYNKLWYPGPGTTRYFDELGQSLVQKAEHSSAACAVPTIASVAGVKKKSRKRSVAAPQRPDEKAKKGTSRSAAAKLTKAAPCAAAAESGSHHAQQSSTDTASQAAAPLPAQSADPAAAASPVLPPPPGAAAWCAEIANAVRKMQEATAWMPSTPGEVPPFLAEYIPQNGEVVTLE